MLIGNSIYKGPGWSLTAELLAHLLPVRGRLYAAPGGAAFPRVLGKSGFLYHTVYHLDGRISYERTSMKRHSGTTTYCLALFHLAVFFLCAWVGIMAERYTRRLNGTPPTSPPTGCPLIPHPPHSHVFATVGYQWVVVRAEGEDCLKCVTTATYCDTARTVGDTVLLASFWDRRNLLKEVCNAAFALKFQAGSAVPGSIRKIYLRAAKVENCLRLN